MTRIPIVGRMAGAVRGLQRQLADIRRVQLQTYERDNERHVEVLLATPRYAEPRRLNRFEAQVFSQSGEDGIIAEIFRRVGAPTRTFVEVGVGDGLENNTAFLLAQGWSGIWVEADCDALKRARVQFAGPIAERRLRVVESFVTAENLPDTLREAGCADDPDLFSLDIDRNTYYAWQALSHLRPRVVVVEYNAVFPADVAWKVEYAPERVWNGSMHWGASLKAYEELGATMGYRLVGCSLSGVNAFFVREDLVEDHFLAPYTAENHYEPPRYWLSRYRRGHPRAFTD